MDDIRRDSLSPKIIELADDLSQESQIEKSLLSMHFDQSHVKHVLYVGIDGLNAITTHKISLSGPLSIPFYFFEINYNDGRSQLHEASIDRVGNYLNRIYEIADLMGGNSFEVDSTKFSHIDHPQPVRWGSWLSEDQAIAINERAKYETEIYPAIREAISRVMNNQSISFRLVDLFAGNGSLVDQIIKNGGIVNLSKIHLIEGTEEGVQIARTRFKDIDTVSVSPATDIPSTNQILPQNIDESRTLVTISGGLNHQVISRDQALAVADNLSFELNSQDVVIVTGLSFCLLNAEDWRERNFSVNNMSIPRNFLESRNPKQLYILTKN